MGPRKLLVYFTFFSFTFNKRQEISAKSEPSVLFTLQSGVFLCLPWLGSGSYCCITPAIWTRHPSWCWLYPYEINMYVPYRRMWQKSIFPWGGGGIWHFEKFQTSRTTQMTCNRMCIMLSPTLEPSRVQDAAVLERPKVLILYPNPSPITTQKSPPPHPPTLKVVSL